MRRGAQQSNGFAAVLVQGSQAAGSLLLQVLAARSLGAAGLGQFGLLYGALVMLTAVASGFVGDSLTVLDRQKASIRSALQNWLVVIAVLSSCCFLVGLCSMGILDFVTAAAFATAVFLFLIEDTFRRLLMANLKFWRILVLDLASIVGVVIFLLVVGTITLSALFFALAFGQFVAILAGIILLPKEERWIGPIHPADYRAVARYGGWRGAQQAVRPALLAVTRVLIVTLAGFVAAGELEAARIYTAPTLLVVAGLSSFLFARFASDRATTIRQAIKSANRAALLLVLIVGIIGVFIVFLSARIGPLITGNEYRLSTIAVGGWIIYSVSVAITTPFGALAAVWGKQAAVFTVRVADSLISLMVTALLLVCSIPVDYVPFALAVGSILGASAIRFYILGSKRIGLLQGGRASGVG